jgi:dipeptidyl-peptidase-4
LLLLAGFSAVSQTGNKDFTLEDIFQKYIFHVASMPGFNGMKDGRQYTRMDKDGLTSYDLATGKETGIIFPNPKGLRIEDYTFSKDEHKLLIYTEGENIYRRIAATAAPLRETKPLRLCAS